MRKVQLTEPLVCPRCDGESDALVFGRWGERTPEEPAAFPALPYICGLCGSLLIALTIPDAELPVLTVPSVEELVVIRANAALWAAIREGRAQVLARPGRRPVLR